MKFVYNFSGAIPEISVEHFTHSVHWLQMLASHAQGHVTDEMQSSFILRQLRVQMKTEFPLENVLEPSEDQGTDQDSFQRHLLSRLVVLRTARQAASQ